MSTPRTGLSSRAPKLERIGDSTSLDRKDVVWQTEGYRHADLVGELGYYLTLKSNVVSKCILRPERQIPGTDTWEDDDDPRSARVLQSFVAPTGGQSELLRTAALHWDIAGEAFLVGTPLVDERQRAAGLVWEFLSTLEFKIENKKATRMSAGAGGGGQEQVPFDGYWAHLLNPDPAYSGRATSTVKRVLPILQEIVLLTQLVEAVAKSRIAAGIWFVPWEITMTGSGDESDQGAGGVGHMGDDLEEFEEELGSYLREPIDDNASVAALIPMLLRGPAMIGNQPTKDLLGMISFGRDLDRLFQDLRIEALARLNGGLDAPPEIISGKGSLNHWTGYNIDDEFLGGHVEPVGNRIADFSTSAYYRPMLAVMEGMLPEEAQRRRLRFDTSPVVRHADAAANTRDAWDRIIASDVAYGRAAGLDEGDMADEEEQRNRILQKMIYAQPALLGPTILPILFPDDPAIQAAEWPSPGFDQGGTGSIPDPSLGQPGSPSVGAPSAHVRSEAELTQRLVTAADAALEAALRTAGNRLLARATGDHESLGKALRGHRREEVLTGAGQKGLEQLGVTAEDLLDGTLDEFGQRARSWICDYLVQGDVPRTQADEVAARISTEMQQLLSLHAAAAATTRPVRGPNGLLVPNELVDMAMRSAQGVVITAEG